MIDISKWAFENKKLIYFLIAVLIVGGAYSSYEMSKLEDPEITVKLAMVVTTYPGASAHQVELEVTDVLEPGLMLEYAPEKVMNKGIVQYYAAQDVRPATALVGRVFDDTFDLSFN